MRPLVFSGHRVKGQGQTALLWNKIKSSWLLCWKVSKLDRANSSKEYMTVIDVLVKGQGQHADLEKMSS